MRAVRVGEGSGEKEMTKSRLTDWLKLLLGNRIITPIDFRDPSAFFC